MADHVDPEYESRVEPPVDAGAPSDVESGAESRGEYQVIARRYRPRRFDEVVGQEASAETLRNAILQDRLAHAYLFCGPRGVGKTSMARIFARALICPVSDDRSRPQEEWGIPCGQCDTCVGVHTGDDIDVTEMDGASNRGIEDVREIIESVKYRPNRSRYKIYIVDEVHMLTREAFNAFLKVLEEPPAHVKFIFATTEPHKIPDTVISRCQRFDFQAIRDDDIVRRLLQICEGESVRPQDGLLEEIARISRGGLRDSQTLLDQLISFSEGELLVDDLHRITGRLSDASLAGLSEAVLARRPADVLSFLDETFRAGTDPAVLLEQFIERLRDTMTGLIRENAPAERVDQLLTCLQVLHETASKLKGSPYPQLAVEIALVRLARLSEGQSLEDVLGWLKKLEGQLHSAHGVHGAVPQSAPARRPAGDGRPPSSGGPRSMDSTPPTVSGGSSESSAPVAPLPAPASAPAPDHASPAPRVSADRASGSESTVENVTLDDPPPSLGAGGRSWKASLQERARSRALEKSSPSSPVAPSAELPAAASAVESDTATDVAPLDSSSPEEEAAVEPSLPFSAPAPEPELPPASAPVEAEHSESKHSESKHSESKHSESKHSDAAAPLGATPFGRVRSLWDQIFVEFRERHPQLQPYLRDATIAEGGQGEILLRLSSEFHHKQMSDRGRVQRLEELIMEISGQRWKVQPVLQKKQANESTSGDNGRPAGPPLKDDPLVQKSLKLFRGRIV